MTGLSSLLQRFPSIAENINSVHAMYATLGSVNLMNFGDPKRGNKQFNISCDPFAGKYLIDSLDCPIYFITSDCTRQDSIGFETPAALRNHLKDNPGNRNLLSLYNIWFANAVEPRKERIYIHDACAAISASKFGEEVYWFERMNVKDFPYLPKEKNKWGTIEFSPNPESNIYVSTSLKSPEKYLNLLSDYLR